MTWNVNTCFKFPLKNLAFKGLRETIFQCYGRWDGRLIFVWHSMHNMALHVKKWFHIKLWSFIFLIFHYFLIYYNNDSYWDAYIHGHSFWTTNLEFRVCQAEYWATLAKCLPAVDLMGKYITYWKYKLQSVGLAKDIIRTQQNISLRQIDLKWIHSRLLYLIHNLSNYTFLAISLSPEQHRNQYVAFGVQFWLLNGLYEFQNGWKVLW